MKGKVACVGRRRLFSTTLVFLSPHGGSGVPASAVPLKSSESVYLCHALPRFLGLHLPSFPVPEFPFLADLKGI